MFACDLILMGTIVFKVTQLSKQAEILPLSFLFYDGFRSQIGLVIKLTSAGGQGFKPK